MRRDLRAPLLLVLGGALAGSGCDDGEPLAARSPTELPPRAAGADPTAEPAEPTGPAPGHASSHQCRVIIAAAGQAAGAISGQASAPSEVEATEQAFRAACRQLSPAERPACRDSTRWHPTITVERTEGGAGIMVSVVLRPAEPPQVIGQARSTESSFHACHHATLDACRKAGAEGDCVAAGAFEMIGQSTGAAPR
jgi:hypothetical protein